MAYKGKFTPKNTNKYRGNFTRIIYRSLWERKIMYWCDSNDQIIEWASEEIYIPYFCPTDRKKHKYFPDFWIKIINNGNTKVQVIEVKPKKQTEPPKLSNKMSKKRILTESKAWIKNKAKWQAAVKYCQERDWEFHIITENHPLLKVYKR